MPTFKAVTHDGCEHVIEAQRVVADAAATSFERRHNGRWDTVLALPSDEVREVRRRINELDGRAQWIPETPWKALGTRVAEPMR